MLINSIECFLYEPKGLVQLDWIYILFFCWQMQHQNDICENFIVVIIIIIIIIITIIIITIITIFAFNQK